MLCEISVCIELLNSSTDPRADCIRVIVSVHIYRQFFSLLEIKINHETNKVEVKYIQSINTTGCDELPNRYPWKGVNSGIS